MNTAYKLVGFLLSVSQIIINVLSFDPNAVSHTSKNQLKASLEAGDEELLIYFCK